MEGLVVRVVEPPNGSPRFRPREDGVLLVDEPNMFIPPPEPAMSFMLMSNPLPRPEVLSPKEKPAFVS